MDMPFNINDQVRVKLTTRGIEILRDIHTTLNPLWPKSRRDRFKPPVADSEGWTTWRLWELMEAFGRHIHEGVAPPFETNILIVKPVNPKSNDVPLIGKEIRR